MLCLPLFFPRRKQGLNFGLFRLDGLELNKIHEEGERHGEIDIPFRNVEVKSFTDQGDTNDKQEA